MTAVNGSIVRRSAASRRIEIRCCTARSPDLRRDWTAGAAGLMPRLLPAKLRLRGLADPSRSHRIPRLLAAPEGVALDSRAVEPAPQHRGAPGDAGVPGMAKHLVNTHPSPAMGAARLR